VEAQLATIRAQVGLKGQREVLADRLGQLEVPTIIVWGTHDRVLPYSQAKEAVSRIQEGALELKSDCGHLPHVEQSDRFTPIVARFLDRQAPIDGGGPAKPKRLVGQRILSAFSPATDTQVALLDLLEGDHRILSRAQILTFKGSSCWCSKGASPNEGNPCDSSMVDRKDSR
jgi:hypothetical protein